MDDSLFSDDRVEPEPTTRATAEASGANTTRRSRRAALRLAGGGALVALAGAGIQRSALAQEATPGTVATPTSTASKAGRYAVIRTRIVKADASIDELNQATREGLPPIVRAIPGFVDYYVIQNMDTRERTGVSIYADKTGADESTRQVTAFLKNQGLAGSYEDVEPVVLQGIIVTATDD